MLRDYLLFTFAFMLAVIIQLFSYIALNPNTVKASWIWYSAAMIGGIGIMILTVSQIKRIDKEAQERRKQEETERDTKLIEGIKAALKGE